MAVTSVGPTPAPHPGHPLARHHAPAHHTTAPPPPADHLRLHAATPKLQPLPQVASVRLAQLRTERDANPPTPREFFSGTGTQYARKGASLLVRHVLRGDAESQAQAAAAASFADAVGYSTRTPVLGFAAAVTGGIAHDVFIDPAPDAGDFGQRLTRAVQAVPAYAVGGAIGTCSAEIGYH